YYVACDVAAHHIEQLTDRQLGIIAVYQPAAAERFLRQRIEAQKPVVYRAAPAPAAATMSSTKMVETATILAGLKPVVMAMLQRAKQDLASRIAAARVRRSMPTLQRDLDAIGRRVEANLRDSIDADRGSYERRMKAV